MLCYIWKQKPWVILCVCLWNGLQHLSFFSCHVLVLYYGSNRSKIHYWTIWWLLIWFHFLEEWVGQNKTSWERKSNGSSPTPSSYITPLFPNSFFFITASVFVTGCWGWVVIFLWWMCDLFIRNCRYTVFLHNSNYKINTMTSKAKLFFSQQACLCVMQIQP